MPMAENGNKPWKYTDDILAGVIIVSGIVSKKFGLHVPDWQTAMATAYVFGKPLAGKIANSLQIK